MVRHSRTQKADKPAVVAPAQVELFMECIEEELTPSQMEANKKAEDAYTSALKQIEAARKSANAIVQNGNGSTVSPAITKQPTTPVITPQPVMSASARKHVIPALAKQSVTPKAPATTSKYCFLVNLK